MNKRFTRREKGIFFVTLILIAVYIAFNGVIKPLKADIVRTERKIQDAQKLLRKNQRIIRKAKTVSKKYQEYKETYQQNNPNEKIMSTMISDIEKVAGSLNLQISDMKPQKTDESDLYNRFLVSLKLESALLDTVHFLYILQNNPHFFEVEEIRFDKSARRKSQTKDIKTTLVLSKFYIP